MPEDASVARDVRRSWARPASAHDKRVRSAGFVLPIAIGALVAVLVVAPLALRREVSFVLSKDKVEMAHERLRVGAARYSGADDQGRPFSVSAASAVQQSSKVPIVRLDRVSAELALEDGPATLDAPKAHYDMTARKLQVDGPMRYAAADGTRIESHDVGLDLGGRTLSSDKPVSGQLRLGRFSANGMRADLGQRTVTLTGRARLHIDQRGAKSPR